MTSSDSGSGGVATCPNCGAPLPAALFAHAHVERGRGLARAAARLNQPRSLDQWSLTEMIIGAGTLVLMVALFLPWYGLTSGGPVIESSGAATHGYLWIAFAICLAVLASLVVDRAVERLPLRLPPERQVIIGMTGINLILVLLAFLSKPGIVTLPQGNSVATASPAWTYGAFVALIAAVIAVAAAVQSVTAPATAT
jgi:hypothetical protein